jgi:hypothetical protein
MKQWTEAMVQDMLTIENGRKVVAEEHNAILAAETQWWSLALAEANELLNKELIIEREKTKLFLETLKIYGGRQDKIAFEAIEKVINT